MEKKRIKAAFFDIDGTLVSFKTHKVPSSTLEAIRQLRQLGVKVFVATGRPLPFIHNLGELEFDGIMSTNGACCTTRKGKVVYKYPVPKSDISRMIAGNSLTPIPVLFASNEQAILCNYEASPKEVDDVFSLLNIPLPHEARIEKALDMDVMQVIAFFKTDEEDRIMSEILQECTAERWHPDFADCICRGHNKATGIKEICQYYNFDREETIAFGDGGNDISMLRYAGIGIAMGNADDNVKAVADRITASVDEDGIAKAISGLL